MCCSLVPTRERTAKKSIPQHCLLQDYRQTQRERSQEGRRRRRSQSRKLYRSFAGEARVVAASSLWKLLMLLLANAATAAAASLAGRSWPQQQQPISNQVESCNIWTIFIVFSLRIHYTSLERRDGGQTDGERKFPPPLPSLE